MKFAWEHIVGILALVLLAVGQIYGLTPCPDSFDPAPYSLPWDQLICSPREKGMGHTVRILYVHVPSAWNSLAFYTAAMFCSVAFIVLNKKQLEWASASLMEVGLVLNVLLLMQGSIWARPTWNRWWMWEPRLTSALVMCLTFVGVWLLRMVIMNGGVRAWVGSALTILAWANIPLTLLIVRLLPSIHQMQSNPGDVSDPIKLGWRINALGFFFMGVWLTARRYRLARARARREEAPPLPPRAEEVTA